MNELPKNQLPVLCRVPSMGEDLTLRISANGITQITAGSYRKRYLGGESVVDINGKLHLTKKDFQLQQQKEQLERDRHILNMGGKIKKNVPGKPTLPGTEKSNIKTVAKDRTYTINKTQVNNRIQAMCNAIFPNVKRNAFLGMLTVTFPPGVNEDIAMQALNTWFTALREKGRKVLKQYLWVAERQDGKRLQDPGKATNTVHFHILILNRLPIVYVNRAMRTVLCNMVRDGLIDYPLSAMKRYNGVDLAKDRKTRAVTNFIDPKSRKLLSWYITKYVTKNKDSFQRAAWGCSRGFSSLFTGVTCTFKELILSGWQDLAIPDPVIVTQWFLFFAWQDRPPDRFTDHLATLNFYILEKRGLLN